MYYKFYFQHIVFSLKFLIAYLIPDTPPSVALAIRKVGLLAATFVSYIFFFLFGGEGVVYVTPTLYM